MLARGDTELLDEMRLARVDEQRFQGRLTNRFNAPIQPQGGITTGLGLVAASIALDRDEQVLRSCSTTFVGQVQPGPVEVEVEVLRRGRSASQVRATVRPLDGDPGGHVVIATFVADRATDVGFHAPAPDAPPPEECRDRWTEEGPEHGEVFRPRPTFFGHFDHRLVRGHMPWDTWTPTADPAEVVSWMRWLDTPRDEHGEVSPLAIVAPCDTMPPAVFEQHGPDERWFLVPSVDLTVQLFDTRLGPGDWMLRRNTSRWAGAGLAAADMELFSQDGRPVAFATQLMHVRVADPERIRAGVEQAQLESS